MNRLGSRLGAGVCSWHVEAPGWISRTTKKNIYPENEPSVESKSLSVAEGLF